MVTVKQIVAFVLSITAFTATFYAVGRLMLFLSVPSTTQIEHILIRSLLDNETQVKSVLSALLMDTIWIGLFIVQHSAMKSEKCKSLWTMLGLEVAERSLYNLATAACILGLLRNWRIAPSFALWNVKSEEYSTEWWAFVGVHSLAWIVIYGGSLLMDLPEILGVKQIYYDINKLAAPISYKSAELRRLYSNLRHPSFIGITLILWATNCMSLDRLLLAVLWTVYMFVAWNPEPKDVAYQRSQLSRKKFELSYKLK